LVYVFLQTAVAGYDFAPKVLRPYQGSCKVTQNHAGSQIFLG
jgi:hypothetical protein